MVLLQSAHGCYQFGVATLQQRRKHVFLLLGMMRTRCTGEECFDSRRLMLCCCIHPVGFDVLCQCGQLREMHMYLLVAGIQCFKTDGLRVGFHRDLQGRG